MSLTTQQRWDRILSKVYERGHVTVKDMAGELAVSEATVRRDLRSLADTNRIELVYGGATLPRNVDYSFGSKSVRNVEAKRVIGSLAIKLINDGDQIFVDSGTTCFELAPLLKRKRGLSVIVNSVRLVGELNGTPGLSIITLGGQYRSDRMDTIGPLATSTLDQLRGYKAFLGADGLSMEFGVTAADIESAHLYRMAVRNARESILLVDHAKFLSPSLFKIVEWDAISRVITDSEPPAPWREFLDSHGIETIHPSSGPAEAESGNG
ncbi:MAG: DeoR/GlpR transcriptional regulator [Phycisphaerae bacterium]|nr:DeoR/GlpR transcriptional regulator [Phycisphaerae bacterium]